MPQHPSMASGSRSPESKLEDLASSSPRRSRSPRAGAAPTEARSAIFTGNPEEPSVEARLQALEAALAPEVRERMQRLVDEGTVRPRAFDAEALTAFAALSQCLQERVLAYMESERIYLMNSRSKSGFLVSACDRAKAGSLDVRGLCVQDPWRQCLLAVAVPKRRQIDLVPESQWRQQCGSEAARISVDVSIDKDIGVGKVMLALLVTHTVAALKSRLAAVGVSIPVHKMLLKEERVGFLKNDKSLAFYNLQSGSLLHLVYKTRAGVAARKGRAALALDE